jgi:hypothetical protein
LSPTVTEESLLRPKKNYVDQKELKIGNHFAEAARTLSDEKKQEQMVEH